MTDKAYAFRRLGDGRTMLAPFVTLPGMRRKVDGYAKSAAQGACAHGSGDAAHQANRPA
jgi:hypothetical protein